MYPFSFLACRLLQIINLSIRPDFFLFLLPFVSNKLASTPVSAAICPTPSVNLLSRNQAHIYDVNDANGIINLLITAISFLSQERATAFSFVVVDKDFAFEILLGSQWECWCTQNRGAFVFDLP